MSSPPHSPTHQHQPQPTACPSVHRRRMMSGAPSHQFSSSMTPLSEFQWMFFWLLVIGERLAGDGVAEALVSIPPPLRPVHLVLSSKLPVAWLLKAEQLPGNLRVLVQLSGKSSVESDSLPLHVQTIPSLPSHPRSLHRWALKHHGNLSSLTHAAHGNRVYINLGEDPALPDVCQLEPTFLSPNYATFDLQPQPVQGCVSAGGANPQVHVVKLHSTGSELCGCRQAKVTVFLVPPVASARARKVELILSSLVPVSWAISACGVQGHIHVHTSNSVSWPYPSEPNLTRSSTLDSDLSAVSDLLAWAAGRGHTVTSYTEARLANRFVIKLAGGRTDEVALLNSLVVRRPLVEERRLRDWLNTRDGRESVKVNCEGGLLNVTVDNRSLQSLSVPVAAVTLRDPRCQAVSNGSHFLLALPVIFCGTEAVLLGKPKGVQYKNMILLWRDEPQTTMSVRETEESKRPLSVHISCFVAIPFHPTADDNVTIPISLPLGRFPRAILQSPDPGPGLSHRLSHVHNSEPALLLNLFVTEGYEQTWIGPCVITVGHRVYAEISAKAAKADVAQVRSCFVSPVSDPQKSPFWMVISDGCASDSSLELAVKREKQQENEGDRELEDTEGLQKGRSHSKERKDARKDKKIPHVRGGGEDPLRFNFILRPVFNDSIQFLHCSVLLCLSDSNKEHPIKDAVQNHCLSGIPIPPLVSRSPNNQCEIRNLYRPMVVTHPISSPAPNTRDFGGPRTRRRSITPVIHPDPEQDSPVLQTGLVMGIAFAAFVIGVSMMGALWCIYNYTGGRPVDFRERCLRDQTHGGQDIGNPPSPDQSSV